MATVNLQAHMKQPFVHPHKSIAHVRTYVRIRFITYPRKVEELAKALGIIHCSTLILVQREGLPSMQGPTERLLSQDEPVRERLTLCTVRCTG